MSNGGQDYFVVIAGKSEGPMTLTALGDQVAQGRVTGQTLVWKEGMSNWQAASSVAEVAGLFRTPAPAPAFNSPPQQQPAPQSFNPAPAPQQYHQQPPYQQPQYQQPYQPQANPYHQGAVNNPYPASNPYQPQAIDQGLYADFGQRFISGLIDNLIYLGIYLVGFLIVTLFFLPQITILSIIGGILAIPVYIAPFGYLAYFMSDKGGGQTIGDKVAGYRTVHEPTGQPMSLGKALIWVLIFAFVGFIGWIWILIDPKRRALHNIVSESVAIRTK
jgi:uncharacterized RDD family membrane protein YckC